MAPTDPLPVVHFDAKAGERSLDIMRWGLIPFWAKDGVIALLVHPNNANAEGVIRYAQEAAHAKRVQLAVQNAGTEAEIDAAFASLGQLHAGGLVVDADGFIRAGYSKS